jgi:predicted small metal-binding protein
MTTTLAPVPVITRYTDDHGDLGFTCSCGLDTDCYRPTELETAITEHLSEDHGMACPDSPDGRHHSGPRCSYCEEVLWGAEDQ